MHDYKNILSMCVYVDKTWQGDPNLHFTEIENVIVRTEYSCFVLKIQRESYLGIKYMVFKSARLL